MRHNEIERERVGEKYNLRNLLSINTLKLSVIIFADLWFFVLADLWFFCENLWSCDDEQRVR